MSMMYSRLIPPLVILSLVDVGRALMTDEPPVVIVFTPSVLPQPALGTAALLPPAPPPTALPPLLTPITLENRGGTCGRTAPLWLPAAEAAGRETPGRALLYARALQLKAE